MKISLKKQAEANSTFIKLLLDTRLPSFVHAPCEINCTFEVNHHQDYGLLTFELFGVLFITCQRCSKEFSIDYHHQNQLAICRNDEVAEKIMPNYDVMVSPSSEIDLREILTDELHLYAPEKHPNIENCDEIALEYLDYE